MMMTRPRLFFVPALPFAALVLLSGVPAWAQQPPPPQKIDVTKLVYSQDDVVVPVPSEIFHALDNLGGSLNWPGEVAPDSKSKPTNPAEIAMLLGTVIANGFIAVEAKQSDKVQEIGHRVIELASALSVREAVIAHCNAIIDASKLDDWRGVRAELDRTQSSVREAMEKLHSRDQAELVSIAGWLRGTQALSSLVSKDYKPDRAELLHQPDMLSAFDKQFKGMEPRVQNNRKVTELRQGLQKIRPLVDNPEITEKPVEQIHQITNELVKSIAP